jgi:hypothetical protein
VRTCRGSDSQTIFKLCFIYAWETEGQAGGQVCSSAFIYFIYVDSKTDIFREGSTALKETNNSVEGEA